MHMQMHMGSHLDIIRVAAIWISHCFSGLVMASSSGSHCIIDEDMLEELYGTQNEWKEHEPEFLCDNAESLIPIDYTPDDIKEAFMLWSFPAEAYPATPEINYTLTLKTHPDAEGQVIHVHLRRQAFRTYPKHKKTCTLELLVFTSM